MFSIWLLSDFKIQYVFSAVFYVQSWVSTRLLFWTIHFIQNIYWATIICKELCSSLASIIFTCLFLAYIIFKWKEYLINWIMSESYL